MNRRQMIQTLALTALGASTCLSGSSIAETPAAGAGGQVAIKILKDLHVGETSNYDGNLKITFLSVIDDSRCPINAKCVGEGDAEVVLRIKVGNRKAKSYWLHTKTYPKQLVIPANPAKSGTTGIPKSYLIDIATLNPLPIAGKKTKQSEYVLGLHVAVVL